MSSKNRELYFIRDEGDESVWMAPEPAEAVIVEEVVAATDLEADDVEPLEDYVDFETLSAVLQGDAGSDELTFTVEDWSVTVERDGTVTVAEA